jgi:hypothetical protein
MVAAGAALVGAGLAERAGLAGAAGGGITAHAPHINPTMAHSCKRSAHRNMGELYAPLQAWVATARSLTAVQMRLIRGTPGAHLGPAWPLVTER